MNDNNIIRRNFESGRRILVTSDVHGQLTYLESALKKAEFCDDDILVIVGDIVEKGDYSLKTLRRVMELSERDNVFVLLGNVDIWRIWMINGICEESAPDFLAYLERMRSWGRGTSLYDEMTSELGYLCRTAEDVVRSRNEVMEHFKREIDFIANLPTVLEVQNYIFVHGGLRDKTVEESMDRDSFSLMKYDSFMDTELEFDKYVVVGHWPVNLYGDKHISLNPVMDHKKKIISIDGGCGIKSYAQLNMLIIPDIDCSPDEIYHISYDELPIIRAIDSQDAAEADVYIKWTNNRVEVLGREGDRSYIRHVSSGREFWIPNTFLYGDNQCRDYANNLLNVSAGDRLSLIEQSSEGYFVKKDGVVGWYRGRADFENR